MGQRISAFPDLVQGLDVVEMIVIAKTLDAAVNPSYSPH
jgi:hypothetical protein